MGTPWRRQRGVGLRAWGLSYPETRPAQRPLGTAMNENVARPIAVAHEPPAFELNPNAHRIGSDQEALTVARELAAEFAQEAARRDRERRLSAKELDRFSGIGPMGDHRAEGLWRGGRFLRDARRNYRNHFRRRPKPGPALAES